MTDIAPEVIDISRLDSNGPVITLSKDDGPPTPGVTPTTSPKSVNKPSVNFGGGIELLMNEKVKAVYERLVSTAIVTVLFA